MCLDGKTSILFSSEVMNTMNRKGDTGNEKADKISSGKLVYELSAVSNLPAGHGSVHLTAIPL